MAIVEVAGDATEELRIGGAAVVMISAPDKSLMGARPPAESCIESHGRP